MPFNVIERAPIQHRKAGGFFYFNGGDISGVVSSDQKRHLSLLPLFQGDFGIRWLRPLAAPACVLKIDWLAVERRNGPHRIERWRGRDRIGDNQVPNRWDREVNVRRIGRHYHDLGRVRLVLIALLLGLGIGRRLRGGRHRLNDCGDDRIQRRRGLR